MSSTTSMNLVGVGIAIVLIAAVIIGVLLWRAHLKRKFGPLPPVPDDVRAAGDAKEWASLNRHHMPVWTSDPAHFTPAAHHRLIAITAPYALCHHDPWELLDLSDPDDNRTMIERDWGISSRAELIEQLHSLLTDGHRSTFAAERDRWSDPQLAEADAARFRLDAATSQPHAEALWRVERMRNNERNIRNIDYTAWDLIRAAMLARNGAVFGWLTSEQAWDTLALIDWALHQQYSSWAQLWEAFRVTRWWWISEGGETERWNDLHDRNRGLALLSPGRPWAVVPWDMPVPGPQLLIVDDMIALDGAEPMGPQAREYATGWERWIDDQIRARTTKRPGTHRFNNKLD
ncbi:DUF1266 domain-containing protein [Schaalia sp. HMT-877]|nr:hypothetical protein HMPREF1550_01318 [Actinomyces sp. oral taxon 877 str. F0543]WLD80381.1 DUF1266 domain-containing protein [Schaalia sp. HMT-877]